MNFIIEKTQDGLVRCEIMGQEFVVFYPHTEAFKSTAKHHFREDKSLQETASEKFCMAILSGGKTWWIGKDATEVNIKTENGCLFKQLWSNDFDPPKE